jgi:hypothetical protein
MTMVSLYTNNDKYYLIIMRGSYFNTVIELGKSNQEIISNEILSTFRELPFTIEEISNILIKFKNLSTPIHTDYITNIDNNRFLININRFYIVNNWLDVHNYILY